jgi:ATP-dependent Clp protease ATP-binding subunit ClpA
VFFEPLNINHLSSIIRLQLQSFEECIKDEHIKITLTDEVMKSILNKSCKLTKIHINFIRN